MVKKALLLTLCTAPLLAHSWAEQTLAKLTLEQKIGQLFMVAAVSECAPENKEAFDAFLGRTPYTMDQPHVEKLIQEYYVGGIIFLGYGTPHAQHALTNHYQNLSTIPLLIGLDAEWGLSMRLAHTIKFPRNGVLGTINDAQLTYRLGHEIGKQLKLLGVHINFAPVVDINNNPKNPVIRDRSFGNTREIVAVHGAAYMHGLHEAGIVSCAKHFPGHGDIEIDSHYALPTIAHSREHLEQNELWPFRQLIQHGVPAVMLAHLAVPALEPNVQTPTSVSRSITTLLRTEFNFQGLIITDGLGMKALTNQYEPGQLELTALLAGNDILLCPVDVPRAQALIKDALHDGLITESELDAHVLRILQAKEWARAGEQAPAYDHAQLHTPAAYTLQAELVSRR